MEGLGCGRRRTDGMIEQRAVDGSLYTTHGADPNHSAEPAYTSNFVTFTDERPIRCRDTSETRIVAVYTYLSGSTNRVDMFRDDIRAQVRRINHFLNENSLRTSPESPQLSDYRVECNADGYIRVLAVASSGSSWGATRDSLIRAGHDDLNAKYLIAGDYEVTGACGFGELYTGDQHDDRDVDNRHNKGRMYGLVYRDCWSYSDMYMHELSHTMGAVQDSARNSSGAGHCNDGIDVMCYGDGGTTSNYTNSACSVLRFDCGGNDYFDTNTGAGQYLDSHWNIGWGANRFIYTRPQ